MKNHKQIVICDGCNGRGYTLEYKIKPRGTEKEERECKRCAGTGRLIKEVKFYPYNE